MTPKMMGPSYPVLNSCEFKLKKHKKNKRRQIVTGAILSSRQRAMLIFSLLLLKCWYLGVFHICLYFFFFKCYFKVMAAFVCLASDRIPLAETLLRSRNSQRRQRNVSSSV